MAAKRHNLRWIGPAFFRVTCAATLGPLLWQSLDGKDAQRAVSVADPAGFQIGRRRVSRLRLLQAFEDGDDHTRRRWRAGERDRPATRREPPLTALGKRPVG